ncbi:MAG: VOC family protein [Cyanobacteria bacterium P01_A01_bin.68]
MSQSVFPNLVTNDIESTISWYQQNLDAKPKMSVPSKTNPNKACFATITVADNDIMLQTIENIEDKYPHLKGQVSIGQSVALNVQVIDAQAVFENLTDKSKVVIEPMDTFYQMREFTIKDPNGYMLTVASPLNR